MPVGSRTFWLPRRGNSPDEYEDAFALDDASGRYAVADGATEGCFTGLWARLLVEDFVSRAEQDASRWPSALPAVEERWDADVRTRKLDWDADYWVQRGASAAFLGVVLARSGKGDRSNLPERPRGGHHACMVGAQIVPVPFSAVAVGDTCLFHTRDGVLLRAFPLDSSERFGNRPQLVGSRMPVADARKRQRLWSDGCGQLGDRLWAMTDALAKWCLGEHESGGDPWSELESLLETETPAFAPWIESLRDSNRLLNDDVTLLVIRL